MAGCRLAPLSLTGNQWAKLSYPSESCVVNFYTTLSHDFFQITIGYGVTNIEEHCIQNNIFGIMVAFKIDHEVIFA
jgi:hypothetical protein